MSSTLIDHQNPPTPHKPNNFIAENFELALNQSIQDLLDSHHETSSDFSVFISIFRELMQSRANPPLETIWVYSALTFRRTNSPKFEPLDRVSATKNLFQLISSCSASCSSSKSIALLGPVVYEVYRVIVELKDRELGSKREEKVRREIRSLVDAILGFISVCCGGNHDLGLGSDSDGLFRPLDDLIRVWIGETFEGKEGFKVFFPLLSDDIVGWLSLGGIGVGELAGVVIMEAFLLRLCLDFGTEVPKEELQKELTTWAVGSLTGFRHIYFFDTLVRMLLECSLPVTCLLSSEDEIFPRKVLYDAVVLAEYSFLNPDKAVHVPAKHIKSLAMGRLMVTHEAVELHRENGDQTKAICYINAFSSSQLPSQLIKFVTSEIGIDRAGRPKGSSPKAFLKWLLNLEDQGIGLLDDGIAKYRAKLALDSSEAEFEQLASKTEGKQSDADLLFYIDNKGNGEGENEEDEGSKESISAAFMAAAHTLMLPENSRERKRKEARRVEKKKPVKFLKYNLYDDHGSSGEKSTVLRSDGSSSESEVENPLSDEESEEKDK